MKIIVSTAINGKIDKMQERKLIILVTMTFFLGTGSMSEAAVFDSTCLSNKIIGFMGGRSPTSSQIISDCVSSLKSLPVSVSADKVSSSVYFCLRNGIQDVTNKDYNKIKEFLDLCSGGR